MGPDALEAPVKTLAQSIIQPCFKHTTLRIHTSCRRKQQCLPSLILVDEVVDVVDDGTSGEVEDGIVVETGTQLSHRRVCGSVKQT